MRSRLLSLPPRGRHVVRVRLHRREQSKDVWLLFTEWLRHVPRQGLCLRQRSGGGAQLSLAGAFFTLANLEYLASLNPPRPPPLTHPLALLLTAELWNVPQCLQDCGFCYEDPSATNNPYEGGNPNYALPGYNSDCSDDCGGQKDKAWMCEFCDSFGIDLASILPAYAGNAGEVCEEWNRHGYNGESKTRGQVTSKSQGALTVCRSLPHLPSPSQTTFLTTTTAEMTWRR